MLANRMLSLKSQTAKNCLASDVHTALPVETTPTQHNKIHFYVTQTAFLIGLQTDENNSYKLYTN
jgi:hypothetical protein